MSAILDTFHPDYVLAASDTLDRCEAVKRAEADLSWETRTLLEEICASVDAVTEECEIDFSDSLADLDELFDRHDI